VNITGITHPQLQCLDSPLRWSFLRYSGHYEPS